MVCNLIMRRFVEHNYATSVRVSDVVQWVIYEVKNIPQVSRTEQRERAPLARFI